MRPHKLILNHCTSREYKLSDSAIFEGSGQQFSYTGDNNAVQKTGTFCIPIMVPCMNDEQSQSSSNSYSSIWIKTIRKSPIVCGTTRLSNSNGTFEIRRARFKIALTRPRRNLKKHKHSRCL